MCQIGHYIGYSVMWTPPIKVNVDSSLVTLVAGLVPPGNIGFFHSPETSPFSPY